MENYDVRSLLEEIREGKIIIRDVTEAERNDPSVFSLFPLGALRHNFTVMESVETERSVDSPENRYRQLSKYIYIFFFSKILKKEQT